MNHWDRASLWGVLIVMRKINSPRYRFGVGLATAALALGLIAAPSPAMAAEHTAVSITKIAPSSGKTVVAGQKIVISGKASANLKGKKLTLQVKVGSKWKTLSASPKVSAKLTYSATVKAVGLGKTSYRVVFPGTKTGKQLAKSTKALSTTVWKWFPLAGQKTVESKSSYGWYEPYAKPNTVAGVFYDNAITGRSKNNSASWTEWNVSFQCSTFTALAGTGDNSPSNTTGSSWASVDGETIAASTVALKLGKPTAIKVDVRDAMRLRLTVTSPNSSAAEAVWADAKILCKKNVNPQN